MAAEYFGLDSDDRMTVCAAYGCKNRLSKGCGKHFFRFPMKNPEYLAKWLAVIRRDKWKPSIYSRLCSDHFTEEDYMLRPGAVYPYLRLDAVPSIINGVRIKKPPVKKPAKKIESAAPSTPVAQKPSTLVTPEVTMSVEHSYSSVSSNKENVRNPKVDPVLVNLRRKKNSLQKQVLRQKARITNMKKMIMQLRNNMLGSDPVHLVSKHFSGLTLELFRHQVQKNKKPKVIQFSKEVKGFAVTLYHYSPVAYELSRVLLSLPDLDTLRKWMPSVVEKAETEALVNSDH
ncbi:THAP domain-containing protein 1-like isoform X2 [Hyla sarda]|uniref:THAP domain-containing protein 1-like isoform X2 n=1 Tax=Hyla sarda TaxID=327740 RepID=UPI0024C2EEB2|nr:THAP domain-containing protein 1-like isoform X2 [Hyla sarda]